MARAFGFTNRPIRYLNQASRSKETEVHTWTLELTALATRNHAIDLSYPNESR